MVLAAGPRSPPRIMSNVCFVVSPWHGCRFYSVCLPVAHNSAAIQFLKDRRNVASTVRRNMQVQESYEYLLSQCCSHMCSRIVATGELLISAYIPLCAVHAADRICYAKRHATTGSLDLPGNDHPGSSGSWLSCY